MRLTPTQMSQIEWRAFNDVTAQMKKDRRIQVMKIVHNHWPTMAREFDWKRAPSNVCPLCQKYTETRSHIFQCRQPSVLENRAAELEQLRNHLQQACSHPLIAQHL